MHFGMRPGASGHHEPRHGSTSGQHVHNPHKLAGHAAVARPAACLPFTLILSDMFMFVV